MRLLLLCFKYLFAGNTLTILYHHATSRTFIVSALYGYLFSDKPETAFAIYRIFESAGFIIAFSYSNYLCTSVKIYVTLSFLVVGMTLYGAVEIMDRRRLGDKTADRSMENQYD